MLSERSPDARSVVADIDEALGERVVVTGSLPPEGRDVDLLVTDDQARRLPLILARQGFRPRPPGVAPTRMWTQQWVRLEGCSALAIDLNPMGRWGLPSNEQGAVVAEAVPINGCRNFARPAPHHTLLMLARRLATGPLPAGRLRKLGAAVEGDPLAWERAADRADAWGARAALSALRALHEEGRRPTGQKRARFALEAITSTGVSGLVSWGVRKMAASAPRRPKVIALSGLDGSGKSSQVRALTSLLEQLDVAVVVEWKPLGHNRSIRALRKMVKRALARARGLDYAELDRIKQPGRSLVAGVNPALLGGRQRPLLTHVWATMVCLASAGHYRIVALRQAGSGRVILFDRFGLDTMAQLRFFYGPERSFSLQRVVVRALAPKPLAAWLLDVPGEVALARKPEQYDLDQLRQQEVLLREEASRLGVTRLDGTRPMPDICQEIATAVWERMGQRT